MINQDGNIDYIKEYQRGRAIYDAYRKKQALENLIKTVLISLVVSVIGRALILVFQGFNIQEMFDGLFVLLFLSALLVFTVPFVLAPWFNKYRETLAVGQWVIQQHLTKDISKDKDFNIIDAQKASERAKTYIELTPDERHLMKQAVSENFIFAITLFDEDTIFLVGDKEFETGYDIDVLLAGSTKPIFFTLN